MRQTRKQRRENRSQIVGGLMLMAYGVALFVIVRMFLSR